MYGGSVLSCTVRERAECRIVLDAPALIVHNAGEAATLATRDDLKPLGDKLDIARAALLHFDIDPKTARLEIHLNTAIPMRAGLAGSTAMLASLVGALGTFLGHRLSPYDTAETMRKIEARIMHVTCGFQDQHMAVFGGLNFMNFAGKEKLTQDADEPLATIEPLAHLMPDVPLLLAHTGIQHHSGTVHSPPRERWLAGEPLVVRNYKLIGELTQHAKRALLHSDWPALGKLMNENHALAAELGGSGPENDRLIEAALAAGAWGAKLAGAGGGGTIVALTNNPHKVGEALMSAGAERLLTPAPSPGLTVKSV
jgi:galactokinase/mevalonate kinase-like predicted kinase